MSPLAHSLIVFAVLALLNHACADLDLQNLSERCTTEMIGKKEGVERRMDPVDIPAGVRSTTVNVSRLCIDNINLAEIAIVCDDVAPSVTIRNYPNDRHWPLNTAVDVTRRGDYRHNVATLEVSLWCPH